MGKFLYAHVPDYTAVMEREHWCQRTQESVCVYRGKTCNSPRLQLCSSFIFNSFVFFRFSLSPPAAPWDDDFNHTMYGSSYHFRNLLNLHPQHSDLSLTPFKLVHSCYMPALTLVQTFARIFKIHIKPTISSQTVASWCWRISVVWQKWTLRGWKQGKSSQIPGTLSLSAKMLLYTEIRQTKTNQSRPKFSMFAY